MKTNPRPWKLVDPMKREDQNQEGWLIVDANGESVAVLFNGTYETDKAAAELIVETVNEVKP